MLIEDMTPDLHKAICEIWQENSSRLADEMRDLEVVDNLLFADGGATQWHVILDRPTLMVVGEIKPGLSASILLLNHQFAEIGEIFHELREVIDTLELKRLTASVPGPVKDVQRALER